MNVCSSSAVLQSRFEKTYRNILALDWKKSRIHSFALLGYSRTCDTKWYDSWLLVSQKATKQGNFAESCVNSMKLSGQMYYFNAWDLWIWRGLPLVRYVLEMLWKGKYFYPRPWVRTNILKRNHTIELSSRLGDSPSLLEPKTSTLSVGKRNATMHELLTHLQMWIQMKGPMSQVLLGYRLQLLVRVSRRERPVWSFRKEAKSLKEKWSFLKSICRSPFHRC